MTPNDFPPPYPVQFQGSAVARWLLRRMGWRVDFQGLPGLQGVLAVYPHTSNWDFVVLLIVKWAIGIPVRFWGKDSLFRFPVFGHWMRYLGGVPVERTSAKGVVGDTVAHIQAARTSGWRSHPRARASSSRAGAAASTALRCRPGCRWRWSRSITPIAK